MNGIVDCIEVGSLSSLCKISLAGSSAVLCINSHLQVLLRAVRYHLAEKFKLQEGEKVWAAEHVVGVAQGVSEDILSDLRANFEGECSEVGMYLAMARVAHREGYPEIGLYWEKAAYEEAEHAAKFAELLGEVVTDSTKKNLEMRVDAENGATAGKFELAKLAKQYNLDAIHDTVHEMARDEARHGKALKGLLERYFG